MRGVLLAVSFIDFVVVASGLHIGVAVNWLVYFYDYIVSVVALNYGASSSTASTSHLLNDSKFPLDLAASIEPCLLRFASGLRGLLVFIVNFRVFYFFYVLALRRR